MCETWQPCSWLLYHGGQVLWGEAWEEAWVLKVNPPTLSRNTRNPNLYKLQPTTSVLIGLISLKINYLNLSAFQAQLKIGWNLYYLFTIQNRAFQNLCPFIAWKYRLKHDSDKYVCKNFHTNFKEKKIKIKTFRKILFKNW